MKCAEVAEMLPAYVRDHDAQGSFALRRHLSRCPDCRAELAHYETLAQGLRSLTTVTADPPAGLEQALAAIPANEGRAGQLVRHVRRNRRAYTGGVAVALIGATGATILLKRRGRLAAA